MRAARGGAHTRRTTSASTGMVSQNPGSQGTSAGFVGRGFVPGLAFAADAFRGTAGGSAIAEGMGGDGAARSGHAVGGTSAAVTDVEVDVMGAGAAVADPEPPSATR